MSTYTLKSLYPHSEINARKVASCLTDTMDVWYNVEGSATAYVDAERALQIAVKAQALGIKGLTTLVEPTKAGR